MNELSFSSKFDAALMFAEQAKDFVIRHTQDYEAAGADVARIRDLEKELADEWGCHPVVQAYKVLQQRKINLAETLEASRKTLKLKMFTFENDQEQKRREEEARIAADLKAKADADALALAQAAQDAGDSAGAEAVLDEAINAPAQVVVIPKQTPKIAGHVRRVIPKFRIVNEALIPRQYLTPDEKKIGGVIRSLKSAANIPGVQYFEEVA